MLVLSSVGRSCYGPFLMTVMSHRVLNTDNNLQVTPRVTEANQISKKLLLGSTL